MVDVRRVEARREVGDEGPAHLLEGVAAARVAASCAAASGAAAVVAARGPFRPVAVEGGAAAPFIQPGLDLDAHAQRLGRHDVGAPRGAVNRVLLCASRAASGRARVARASKGGGRPRAQEAATETALRARTTAFVLVCFFFYPLELSTEEGRGIRASASLWLPTGSAPREPVQNGDT